MYSHCANNEENEVCIRLLTAVSLLSEQFFLVPPFIDHSVTTHM